MYCPDKLCLSTMRSCLAPPDAIPMKLRNILYSSLAAFAVSLAHTATANIFDGGVDSENLGKGDWIYYMSQATNKLGGNVSSVINIPTLMSYYQSQGISHIIVKAGTGSTNFPSNTNPQFTSNLVYQAHLKGIKIFGYTRSYGDNIQGEINIATSCFNKGADGFVIDAEAEWEASRQGTQGPAKAIQLASGIKNLWPTKFLAHAPMPYISLHSTFPYKEFGIYCDTVMPQVYWNYFGITPTQVIADMDKEWRAFYNSLSGSDTAAVKPIAPLGQADVSTIPGAEITEFFNAINNDTKCVTKGGYRSVNFWRADLHTSAQWTAIKAGTLTGQNPSEGSTILDNPAATVVGTWTTASSATDKYGADYRYKGPGGGAGYLKYIPSLSARDYQVYEWHSQGSNRATDAPHVITYNGGTQTLSVNQQVNGGKWNWLGTFNFLAGTAGNVKITDGFTVGSVAIADAIKFLPMPVDIIVDNPAAVMMGSWTLASSATDKYGADYRYKGPGSGSAVCMFVPYVNATGSYQVYEWHSVGSNRTTDAKYKINGANGPQVVVVNQQVNGGRWNLLGTFGYNAGTSGTVSVSDSYSTGSVVIADAIKLVFVSQ